ncbi:unnamed protein product [Ilex paraguariensis]|uniref:Uncharacterized protein n=1 Tax=Ilex paraguariensis TaxID=185542 RepID=A0ABC8SXF1_9AQUA
MQSSPVDERRLAMVGPRKMEDMGNHEVGTIHVARRIEGPRSHIGHLKFSKMLEVPFRKSPIFSLGACVTGPPSHEDTFRKQLDALRALDEGASTERI